jgi:hypothetical protein
LAPRQYRQFFEKLPPIKTVDDGGDATRTAASPKNCEKGDSLELPTVSRFFIQSTDYVKSP